MFEYQILVSILLVSRNILRFFLLKLSKGFREKHSGQINF